MTTTAEQTRSANRRWVDLYTAAGYESEKALERAAELSASTIWTWRTAGDRHREPRISSLRQLKKLLGITLDELADLFDECHREAGKGL